MASMPSHADAVTHTKRRHALAERIDHARHLMAGNTRQPEPGPEALGHELIAVTDATGVDPDADLGAARLRDFTVLCDQRLPSGADDHRLHVGPPRGTDVRPCLRPASEPQSR